VIGKFGKEGAVVDRVVVSPIFFLFLTYLLSPGGILFWNLLDIEVKLTLPLSFLFLLLKTSARVIPRVAGDLLPTQKITSETDQNTCLFDEFVL
jgi:hypothetical protein